MSERVAVLVPCYKRPEYTLLCIKSLELAQPYENVTFFLVDDGSNDGTSEILSNSRLNSVVKINHQSIGLRNVIIEFFEEVKDMDFDYLSKMDNDCEVPENWLNNILDMFRRSDADILSPNVNPSNAAYSYGIEVKDKPYLPSSIVGGLWTMKKSVIDGIQFEKFDINGISGAFHILNQIIVEKDPNIGWIPDVVVQDIGHWSGNHPKHIKSNEHFEYSLEVGRKVAWA